MFTRRALHALGSHEFLPETFAVSLGSILGVALRIALRDLSNWLDQTAITNSSACAAGSDNGIAMDVMYILNTGCGAQPVKALGQGWYLPNICGCCIMGFCVTRQGVYRFRQNTSYQRAYRILHMGLTTGLCGCLTTFATWNQDASLRLVEGDWYGWLSVLFIGQATAMLAFYVGGHIASTLSSKVHSLDHRYHRTSEQIRRILQKQRDCLVKLEMAIVWVKEEGTLASREQNTDDEGVAHSDVNIAIEMVSREEKKAEEEGDDEGGTTGGGDTVVDDGGGDKHDEPRQGATTTDSNNDANDSATTTTPTSSSSLDGASYQPSVSDSLETLRAQHEAFASMVHRTITPSTQKLDTGGVENPSLFKVYRNYIVLVTLVLLSLLSIHELPSLQGESESTVLLSILLAPVGGLLRYSLGRLNRNYPNFPLFTFLANMLGGVITTFLGVLAAGHFPGIPSCSATGSGMRNTCIVYTAISTGFCGSLSTVSSYVKETVGLLNAPLQTATVSRKMNAYRYVLLSLMSAQALQLIVNGSFRW